MLRKITSILLSVLFLLTTSCATIFSKSNYPITINSRPSEANIEITNKLAMR